MYRFMSFMILLQGSFASCSPAIYLFLQLFICSSVDLDIYVGL